ncbi:Dihydrodipicolinate synthase [Acidipropionibacterium jensenii]|uniref:Dihydrodipicolinate synthase n=1 Tax=Acidipropionibacterium jensenii TaxID=1749 RepID=A0A448NWU6_9ACTN|nr:dihydrodipicolinate synthase family protein [Acidipropionibacterium jensenii]QCV89150.1 dihydrodipicolinate synthase family protein [Acidipropionibacterium jensenii]VEI02443.1 Dihydrodipicolinate synthase [Acidipropionibacterium jensenii]
MTSSIFTGLSAFPLTPLHDDHVDERAFTGLIERLAAAGVDSITALGSTGSYAYLTPEERARVAKLAVEHAGSTPVFVGVGGLRTSHVLAHIDAAEQAGAAGVLLAPMTYQALTADDVFELYRTVTEHTELPVIVYDNPGTTHFTFTIDLYARVAELPGIASIKIPGVPTNPEEAREHVAGIRAVVPEHVTIGVSGDAFAATGLNAGCEAWYSVIGGTLPEPALTITRAAQAGRTSEAVAESERLAPLWGLFTEFGGSLRVTAAIAEHLGLAPHQCLPLPIQGLTEAQRARVAQVVDELDLA